VSVVHNQVLTDVMDGYNVRNSNQGLAVTYYNDAADLADAAHDPMGLEDIAIGFADLGARSDGANGTAASNFYVQAIAAAEFWLDPNEGIASGTDYAWGSNQWQSVISSATTVANTLRYYGASNYGAANSIMALAENNQISLNTMTSQAAPPLAGGVWQANIGGTNVTYYLTQHDGRVTGSVTENGRTGDFNEVTIIDMSTRWANTPVNTTFGGQFVVNNWNNGGSPTYGYATQSSQDSGHMTIYLWNGTQYIDMGIATRVSGYGWSSY
jgi:hypothetical protein